jgi:N6-adenosine-specific RNA methylase IME4
MLCLAAGDLPSLWGIQYAGDNGWQRQRQTGDHGRKLELFSRNKREGWDMDGNEQSALKAA